MKVSINLPFDFCDICSQFELDARCNDLFGNDNVIDRNVDISCAYRNMCSYLTKNIKKITGKNNSNAASMAAEQKPPRKE